MQRAAAPEHAVGADIGQRHRIEIEMDLVAELFPEVMGQAARLAAATPRRRAGRAARGSNRLVDGKDDIGDAGLVRAMAKEIATARPAHALDQTGDPQLGEKLLEIGK